ncbi:MAG TPA: preprotein translocase subunit YajC [Candidatus Pelethomonas intestinigallinarum]|nr:preprotein translocase subunit YajC [Candidatus Pelethomonas intestinigallinarum]
MEQWSGMIMIVAMLAILYFLMIRPENKRKKQAEEMRNSLKKGDQITTIGGIVGRIVMVTDDTIVIETSDDRVRMELTKWAVSTNNTQQQNAAADKKDKKADKEEPAKIEEGSESETK